MGTAGLGDGNVTPVAEFNIWQDAEAAKIVTESGLDNIIFVGWDACLGDCMLNPKEIKEIRESGKLGKFVIDCNKKSPGNESGTVWRRLSGYGRSICNVSSALS